MIRKIIKISAEKCNGCGLCAKACHEDAIGMIDGKAVLLRDDHCDGLGDCLPVCPTNALSLFEEREALPYNEAEVKKNMEQKDVPTEIPSQLRQWPVQIKLVPVNAAYFDNSNLLIAADCSAYAYGNFHHEFMREKITLIACPKLDNVDYSEKLTSILIQNNIKKITLVRMEVPCCGGIENAIKKSLLNSQKSIPLQITTLSTQGHILSTGNILLNIVF